MDIRDIEGQLRGGVTPSGDSVKYVCERVKQLFADEPTLLHLQAPIAVCGDVHGNFTDLNQMWEIFGEPGEVSYLFLGDYVDRGRESVEVMTLLFCYKLLHPNSFWLTRGNHEGRNLCFGFGFGAEVVDKFRDHSVFEAFVQVFDLMPLAAVVVDEVFCVHGGLSPGLMRMDAIGDITLEKRAKLEGDSMVDALLWSDPYEGLGWSASPRGAGYHWGRDISVKFLLDNRLAMIARGHEAMPRPSHRGLVQTLFSSPSYMGMLMEGAVLEIGGPACRFVTRFRPSRWASPDLMRP